MTERRLDAIDGLRGVAALFVAVYHYQYLFVKDWMFMKWGFLSVDFFFILSGYILTHRYGQALTDKTIGPREFLIDRITRLWPLHMFTLLIMLALDHWAFGRWGIRVLAPDSNGWAFFLNLLLIQNSGLLSTVTWNGPSWSISTEFIINIAWMLCLVAGLWNVFVAVTIVVVGWLLIWPFGATLAIPSTDVYYGFVQIGLLRTAMGFSVGYLIYRFQKKCGRLPFANALSVVVLGTIAAMMVYYAYPNRWFDVVAVVVVFPLVVLLATQDSWLRRMFGMLPLRHLGTWSYAIYLLHLPIATLTSMLLIYFSIPYHLPMVGIVYITTLLVLSPLVYWLVELPCKKTLRHLLGNSRIAPLPAAAPRAVSAE